MPEQHAQPEAMKVCVMLSAALITQGIAYTKTKQSALTQASLWVAGSCSAREPISKAEWAFCHAVQSPMRPALGGYHFGVERTGGRYGDVLQSRIAIKSTRPKLLKLIFLMQTSIFSRL